MAMVDVPLLIRPSNKRIATPFTECIHLLNLECETSFVIVHENDTDNEALQIVWFSNFKIGRAEMKKKS